MKYNKINLLLPIAALALALGMTSCVGDLDVEPINPQQTMIYDEDAVFNKIYASFSLTGQVGPSDNGDIADIDEGSSSFYRMGWYMNEFTTDEASWVWASDAGVPDLLHNTYGAANDFSMGMYYRLYFTITLCNFFLDQTSGSDAETQRRIAEVRFIRALNYYYVMDLYGNAAFTEKVSAELAEYYTRQDFYNYVESELLAIVDDLADSGTNTYGRVDKVAAYLLLSRLYLNAEVYTGTAQWQKALDYAQKVIGDSYYHLNTTGATASTGEYFSPYQMLFLADNNETDAKYEAILPVLCDGDQTQSYGASTFLVLGSYGTAEDAYVPSGTDCSWGKCTRVRRQLLDKFYNTSSNGASQAPNGSTVQEMTSTASDDRALFFGEGYTADTPDESDANAGFSCVKFRCVRSDDGGRTSSNLSMVDSDIPLFRVAEAYLTYAEASTRLNGANADAKEKIDAIRNRANASIQSSYSLDFILSEWSREFWWEGRRRMDLVRYGYFGGQSSFKWEWMGGVYEGTQFSATKNIFAIPENDLANNINLVQNPGY